MYFWYTIGSAISPPPRNVQAIKGEAWTLRGANKYLCFPANETIIHQLPFHEDAVPRYSH